MRGLRSARRRRADCRIAGSGTHRGSACRRMCHGWRTGGGFFAYCPGSRHGGHIEIGLVLPTVVIAAVVLLTDGHRNGGSCQGRIILIRNRVEGDIENIRRQHVLIRDKLTGERCVRHIRCTDFLRVAVRVRIGNLSRDIVLPVIIFAVAYLRDRAPIAVDRPAVDHIAAHQKCGEYGYQH